MNIPFFNYSEELYNNPAIKALVQSDTPLIMLNCKVCEGFFKIDSSCNEKKALENYNNWRQEFLINCSETLSEVSEELRTSNETKYTRIVAECMLMAEMYDWRVFLNIEMLNSTSIFIWVNNELQLTRTVRNFLFSYSFTTTAISNLIYSIHTVSE